MLLDLFADGLRDELLDKVAKLHLPRLIGHDLYHFPADLTDLSCLCVTIILHLVLALLRKCNHKQSNEVAVSGFDINVCLNQRVQLADERHLLVTGKRQAVEISEAIFTLHLLDAQFNFLVRLILVIVQVARLSSSTRPFSSSVAIFVPCVLVTRVFPQLRTAKTLGALMSYHSFFRKMSPCFFLPPFLPPFVRRLFLPTAMFTNDLQNPTARAQPT